MKRFVTVLAAFAAVATLQCLAATPTMLVDSKTVQLGGTAGNAAWTATLTKKLVGTSSGTKFYQWYLSFYRGSGTTASLRYQSPRDGGPFDRVTRGEGTDAMWFPLQSGSLVGSARLMNGAFEQLVVASHQTGADCGSAAITIFRYDDRREKVVPAAEIDNGCDLQATLVTGASGDPALQLDGPYYSPNAALCCPTKPHARAILSYSGGKWIERPAYFTLHTPRE